MYHQNYDPLGNPFLSTVVAAIPILVLLYFIALHRYRDSQGGVHFGISAPGGTPAELIAKLNASINAVLSEAAVRQRMEELGFIMGGGSPQAYAETLRTEIAKWRKVIKDANIPPPS